MKKYVIFALVLLVSGFGIAFQLTRNKAQEAADITSELNLKPPVVQTTPVDYQTFSTTTESVGTVEAYQTLAFASETEGRVREVFFQVGQLVRTGQPMVRLDTDIKATAHQLNRINYEKAKRDLDRLAELQKTNNVASVEVENARLQVQTSENQLQVSEKQLAQALIKAPITGIVAEKKTGVGDYLQPAGPIATLSDISRVIVRLQLPERDVVNVRVGQSVRVMATAFPGATFTGKVRAIVPQAGTARTFPVEVVLPNTGPNRLLVGMSVQARFSSGQSRRVLTIPRTALVGSVAAPGVLVLENKTPVRKPITLGEDYGTRLGVTGGLRAGEQLIVRGQQQVRPGQRVTVVSTPTDSGL